MLVRGKGKAPRARPIGPADALTLTRSPTARFDGAMVAFGVRNLADLDAGLREAHRVLRPAPLCRARIHHTALRAVARASTSSTSATSPRDRPPRCRNIGRLYYLPESVLDFPEPDAFARRLEGGGFSHVGYEVLTGRICAVHHGTR